ncbi:MAG: CvpA family protein [Desulfovermiculus sp.]
MNWLDIVFALIIGLALLRGLWRGVIREVSSLIALAAGFIAAGRYAVPVSGSVQQVVGNPQVAAGLSYVGVFLAVFVCVVVMGALVRKVLHAVLLGWADRLGGGVFGFAKGVLISCLVLFVLTLFVPPHSAWIAESRFSPHLNYLTQKMVILVPDELKESFADKSRELHQAWEQNWL